MGEQMFAFFGPSDAFASDEKKNTVRYSCAETAECLWFYSQYWRGEYFTLLVMVVQVYKGRQIGYQFRNDFFVPFILVLFVFIAGC